MNRIRGWAGWGAMSGVLTAVVAIGVVAAELPAGIAPGQLAGTERREAIVRLLNELKLALPRCQVFGPDPNQ